MPEPRTHYTTGLHRERILAKTTMKTHLSLQCLSVSSCRDICAWGGDDHQIQGHIFGMFPQVQCVDVIVHRQTWMMSFQNAGTVLVVVTRTNTPDAFLHNICWQSRTQVRTFLSFVSV